MFAAQALQVYNNLDEKIAQNSFWAVIIASVLLVVLAGVSLMMKKMGASTKQILFWSITLVTVLCTFYLASATVYLNTVSSSKGPVHWHADTEIWACGTEQELLDPTGLSNKIGTPTLHEHNDKRIHLEGVVVVPENASLASFFHVIGGDIKSDSISFPTNNGLKTITNGDACGDGTSGVWQVFVYKTQNGVYTQEKLVDPASYQISAHSQVPEGDCVIFDFGPEKDRTDRMCRSYKVQEELGEIKKGDQ